MFMSKKTVALGAIAALAAGTAAPALAQQQINGSGASFPAPMFSTWFDSLRSQDGPDVTYEPVNSAQGIRQLVELEVDFGATDRPIAPRTANLVRRGLVQIPVVAGSIAIGYNKDGCDLKLSQQQLSDVLLGTIRNWKTLGCQEGPIKVSTRSDRSGTTLALTKSLSDWSPEFRQTVGTGMRVEFPVGTTSSGNEGVRRFIETTPGSIGYVNVPSIKGKVQAAALQNREGNYMLPNSATGIAALEGIRAAEYKPLAISNPPGRDSYPLVAMSWVLAYENGNGVNTDALKQTFNYMLSNPAQSQADNLGYVPLPESIRKAALDQVQLIKQ